MSQPNPDQSVREQLEEFEIFNMVLSAQLCCNRQREIADDTSVDYKVCRPDDLCPDCYRQYESILTAHKAALDQISAERALAARIDVLDKYVNKKPFSITWVNVHREMTDELAALRQSTGEER